MVVAARVAFMPTSQSASLRARAASSSGCIWSSSRRCAKASVIAFWVIELNHARLTGFARRGLRRRLQMSLKISSPSRPASQALTMTSVVAALMSLCKARSWVWARHLASLVPELLGQDREILVAPLLELGVVLVGSTCSSRWPTANATIPSGPSKKSPTRLALRPYSAVATSRATEGFSQMISMRPMGGEVSTAPRRRAPSGPGTVRLPVSRRRPRRRRTAPVRRS